MIFFGNYLAALSSFPFFVCNNAGNWKWTVSCELCVTVGIKCSWWENQDSMYTLLIISIWIRRESMSEQKRYSEKKAGLLSWQALKSPHFHPNHPKTITEIINKKGIKRLSFFNGQPFWNNNLMVRVYCLHVMCMYIYISKYITLVRYQIATSILASFLHVVWNWARNKIASAESLTGLNVLVGSNDGMCHLGNGKKFTQLVKSTIFSRFSLFLLLLKIHTESLVNPLDCEEVKANRNCMNDFTWVHVPHPSVVIIYEQPLPPSYTHPNCWRKVDFGIVKVENMSILDKNY